MEVLLAMTDLKGRRFLERILRARGHEVTCCRTAAQAEEARAHGGHRLVLVGSSLLAGEDAARVERMRGPVAGRRAFVLAVAEDGGPPEFEGLIEAGANDVLVRQFDGPLVNSRIAVAEELIRQSEAAEAAHAALEARARQSEVLADLGRRALEALDVGPLFEAAVEGVARTLDVEFVKVAEATPDGTELVVKAGVGWKPGVVGRARLSTSSGSQAGYAIRSGKPVVVDDLRKEARFRGATLLKEHGVVSGVSVPIRGLVKPYGVLGAHTARRRAFRPEDVHFLWGVANVLGAAVAHAAADERLRAGEERSRSVLESALDAVVAMDASESIFLWNARAEEMFGWPRVEVLGKRLSEVVLPARDRPTHQEGLLRFLATGAGPFLNRRVEVRALRRDGTEFPVELSVTPVRANGGFSFYAFVRDLSERARAEEDRRALEARMLVAQKAESLGVLAGGIAHDFNNLLTSVLGNAGLAQLHMRPESPARPFVAQVEMAARRAADLTSQLLAYAGKGRLVLERIDVSRLVEEMAALLRTVVPKDVELTLEVARDVPLVECDATQVRQVVMNLITNASEAFAGGAGRVTVSTGRVEVSPAAVVGLGSSDSLPAGVYAKISVSDSGCGMDADTLARIFDPFFTTKRTGRGLGLAAVLGIVRGHRGAIRVHSETARGSTFEILLPSVESAPAANRLPGGADRDWHGTGTVLLVDDEDDVRRAAAAMIRSLGFEVVEAADGLEAVRLFRGQAARIALVVLDLTMPRMDGGRTLERLRVIRPDVPILVSSGYAEDEVRARFARGAPPAGYLHKPYSLEELRGSLRAVLGV